MFDAESTDDGTFSPSSSAWSDQDTASSFYEFEGDLTPIAEGDIARWQILDEISSREEFKLEEPSSENRVFEKEKTSVKTEPSKKVLLSVEEAFEILYQASKGIMDPGIPVRPHASPITPSENCFYVSGSTQQRKRKRVKEETKKICVKYQSFHNTEVWWSPKYDFCLGVVARAMSRKNRSQKSDSFGRPTMIHGFKGKWYSLIKKEKNTPTSGASPNVKSLLVPQVPSLVHFCTKSKMNESILTNPVKTLEKVEASPGAVIEIKSEPNALLKAENKVEVFNRDVTVNGDMVLDGKLSVRSLHVKGDLVVDGQIGGQLVTREGAADYAEWFATLYAGEAIEKGMVVQLRSPEQRITLDTAGEGPHMVVSTQPSVAAGVPEVQKHEGHLCAFLGQVPVKVIGPVRCGDFLFPSGLNDGYAVSAKIQLHADAYQDPIGTSMMSCGPGKHTILAFIRWQHNLKWQREKRTEHKLREAVHNIAQLLPYGVLCLLANFRYFFSGKRKDRVMERKILMYYTALIAWVLFQMPSYNSFVFRDIYVVVPSLAASVYLGIIKLYRVLGKTNADGSRVFLDAMNLATFSTFLYSSVRLKIAATKFVSQDDALPGWMNGVTGFYKNRFARYTEYLEKENQNDPLISSENAPIRYIGQVYDFVMQRILTP